MTERTLILVKPDGVARGLNGEILRRIEAKGYTLVAVELRTATPELLAEHYAEHVGKPFYGALVEFMLSGPTLAVVAEGDRVIEGFRSLAGTTDPTTAAPGTIRGDLGRQWQTVVLQNLVHGSDSVESAEREIGIWFPGGVRVTTRERIEHGLEKSLFATRWLLAPLYVGLVLGLFVVVVTFFVTLWDMVTHLEYLGATGEKTLAGPEEITVAILSLIDIVLIGNLILIVIFAGYENFVSRMASADESEDKPTWMGHVDFSGLKMKLIGSLVAISAILLLKDFVNVGNSEKPVDYEAIGWQIGIHLTFVFSGLVFAIMDYWGAKRLSLLADMHKGDGHAPDIEPYDPAAA